MVADQHLKSYSERILEEHIRTSQACRDILDDLAVLCRSAEDVLRGSGQLLIFGNGGSAADAQHIAAELTVRLDQDRPPLRAVALTTDTSALTASGNDYGFERIFARQVEALARPRDMVIGISTSGNSENVLRGIQAAKAAGAVTAGLTGGDGGKLKDLADHVIVVPSKSVARIQEMHILIGHILVGAVERALGLVGKGA